MFALTMACFALAGAPQNVSLGAPVPQPPRKVKTEATGEITGKVLFEGPKPKPVVLKMKTDPECQRENQGRTVYQQDGEVNADGTLPNVFLFVKSGTGHQHFRAPKQPVVLDQQGCIFVPHVLGLMVGQALKVLNSDFTTHNVQVSTKNNPGWNQSQPPGAAPFYKKFAHPEIMIPVSCNVHPWMKAYVGVVDNPFYGVTGTAGKFTIKHLPDGEYTIEAWTATFGTEEKTVQVRAKQSTTLDFEFHSK